jgi:predicted Rossmann fold flavoprotein
MEDLCIIGAGPAGLMAAIHAAMADAPVLVLETNSTAGRKLLLTGGGRCNFTHAGRADEIAKAFEGFATARGHAAGRFLRHALHEFSPDAVMEFFRLRGLASTTEPDGCVFPAANRAADVRDILVNEAQGLGVRFLYRARVLGSAGRDGGFIIQTEDRQIEAARIILATGGVSWPQTGSKGDGYRLAERLGHRVISPKPALVPLVAREAWVGELAGISLADVRIRATVETRVLAVAGNMLFTQRGIGGPAVLDLSRFLTDVLSEKRLEIPVEIDLFPSGDELQVDRRLQQQVQARARKTTTNALSELLPRQLAQTLCRLTGCDPDLPAGRLTGEKRKRIAATVKGLPLHITGTEPLAKATVTRGGVSRDEIDPRTMESRVRPGLYFAGEVIDLDGPCGGYNLQMCWSTGAVAGRSAAQRTGPITEDG